MANYYLSQAFFSAFRQIKEAVLENPNLRLSYTRLMTLGLVKRLGKPSMRELADLLCISPPSTTSILNQLVRGGELKRTIDPKDHRIIRHSLTKKGQKNLKNGLKIARQVTEEIFSQLSSRDRKELLRILKKVIK